ncbi:hypothetical protein YC2023_107474 [Brassica napus]
MMCGQWWFKDLRQLRWNWEFHGGSFAQESIYLKRKERSIGKKEKKDMELNIHILRTERVIFLPTKGDLENKKSRVPLVLLFANP